jgi:hypothetical protein
MKIDPIGVVEEQLGADQIHNMGYSTPPEIVRKLALAKQPSSDAEHVARVRDLIGQLVLDEPNVVLAYVTQIVIYRSVVANVTAGWSVSPAHPDYNQVVKS